MPYTMDNLPGYVKSKPEHIKKKWIEIFNSVYAKEGEQTAFIVANKWLKRQKTFMKRSLISLEVVQEEQTLLKRSDDGEEYVTFVLGGIEPHKDGKRYSPELLERWANYINANGTIGDIDHTEFDRLCSSGISDTEVVEYIKSKPSIAKGVKAIYDQGRLWVKALIDKRYRALINKAKGVSAEAFVTIDDNNVAVDGELLGFTFNVKTSPADPLAEVVA